MDLKINNYNYKVYFQGNIEEKNVKYIHLPRKKILTPRAKEIVEEVWQKKKAEGEYDGDCVDFLDAKIKKGKNKLNLYIDYTKYRFTLVERNEEYRAENCYLTNHISIPTIIKTKDKKFLIISEKLPQWKFVGGFWEKDSPTITDNVFKEIDEEVGLTKYVSNMRIIGVADSNNKVGIITTVDCCLSSSEITSYIEKNRHKIKDNHEAKELRFVDLSIEGADSILNTGNGKIGGSITFALYCLKNVL
jgi:ADP-ribose pyrophosphatase YjhB (NUDIX family)